MPKIWATAHPIFIKKMKNVLESSFRNAGFYLALLFAAVFFGFYKTYFVALPRHFSDISWMVHLHAAAAVAWILMLVAQPILLRSGRVAAHRFLGKFSYVLLPMFALSALPLLFFEWLRGDQLLLFASVADLVLLLFFYVCAMWNRKNPPVHARYMIATGLVLLDPTLGRLAGIFLELPPDFGNHLPFAVINLILLFLIFADRRAGRNFKPFAVALAAFVLYQIGAYWLAFSFSKKMENLPTHSFPMDNAKIENAEVTAWRDLFAAQPDEFRIEQGCGSAKIEDISVFTCKKIPFQHFNVALDLSLSKAFSEATLDRVLAHFRAEGIPKFYLQITPVTQPEGAAEWLTRRGLRHVSSWHRIARGNEPLGEPLPIAEKYEIEEVSAATAAEWAGFIDEVYGMPTKKWLLALSGRAGWHQVVCRSGGKIVAARSMKINADGSAYFMIDAPIPGLMTQNFEADYLLARRLVEIGLAAGVQFFTSDIEKPSALQDTPAYSFWTALGFRVAYEKRNFMF